MPSKNLGTTTPTLKRGDELEIKFITVASEDMTNSIRYPSFHFMKLQRLDHRSANYIKHQETKSELVINLTENEVSTRRAWGVWVCLTEMDKVKYPFKIYQNSVNGSFLLNTMMGNTTRFANDVFEQKRVMIWENKLIGTESTRRKACNMMHVERYKQEKAANRALDTFKVSIKTWPHHEEKGDAPSQHYLERCGKIKVDDPSTKEKQECGVSWFCCHPKKQAATPNADPATQEILPLHLTAGHRTTRTGLSPSHI
ncbi:hypothetical protein ACS0TY_016942 [Phlomoides rotata]